MKYNCFDFALLCAINNKLDSEDDILLSASSSFPYPPSFHLFESCLNRLFIGGYITKKNGKIQPTEQCKKFFKSKKLFESKDKFISRLEDEFISLDLEAINNIDSFGVSLTKYKLAQAKLISDGCKYNTPFSLVEKDGKEHILVSSTQSSIDSSDEEVTKHGELLLPLHANSHLPAQLFECASALMSPSKAKKVCVFDGKAYFVLTMLQQGPKIKMSAQRIMFNAKRFVGKTNSSLDYAQCEDTSILFYTTQDNLYMSAALLFLEYDCRK